jgi:class 3 adenylate cyclase
MPALDPTAPAPDTTYPHRTALVEAINALQARRTLLGDALTDAALAPLLERLAAGCTPQQAAVPARRLRQVSVLFLDLVGSTHLIQRLDPEEVQAVIDSALASFSAIVERHGGEVLRYAGDSLKAAFGARVTREDDAERAVLCGLDLLQAAARAGDGDGAQLSARVGIHTGAAVRGGGVEQDNSLSGLAVNVAARLEQTAAPGTLRISIDTYRLVQGHFDVLEQPGMQVKGLQEPLRAFVVTGARERRLRGLRFGAEGMTSPLIDRQEELGRLHRLAATAFEPGGGLHAATVLGEAGLGKSRLLAEFQATLPALMRTGGALAGQQPSTGPGPALRPASRPSLLASRHSRQRLARAGAIHLCRRAGAGLRPGGRRAHGIAGAAHRPGLQCQPLYRIDRA